MTAWARAILYGLLSWLIPFAFSFVVYPLKKADAPLFTSLMYLMVLVTAGVLMENYFRKRPVTLQEAGVVGGLWLVMNLIFDFPMFAYGPMRMAPLAYYSEIGIVYVTFPVYGMLAAQLAKH